MYSDYKADVLEVAEERQLGLSDIDNKSLQTCIETAIKHEASEKLKKAKVLTRSQSSKDDDASSDKSAGSKRE